MGFSLGFGQEVMEDNLRVKEIPFDSERKLMTTVNKVGDKFIEYTKGGVDELLELCINYETSEGIKDDLDAYKKEVRSYNENMANGALRVLACAYKVLDKEPTDEEMKNMESGLTFIRYVRNDRSTKA